MTRPSTPRRPLVPQTLRRRARRFRARSRLRAANVRGTGAALRRRPHASASAPASETVAVGRTPVSVATTYGAPRTLLWVTVKRDNPHWFDLYGHWWLEAGEQSWGWWPREVPVGLRQLACGTDGVLNGAGLVGGRGTWQRDPQHGRHAAHCFHPVLVEAIPDEEVLARLRTFAYGYRGEWRWAWTRRSTHGTCRTFQDGLLRAAGLTETLQDLPSRGSGCPWLYPPRTVLWRSQDLFDAARDQLPRWTARHDPEAPRRPARTVAHRRCGRSTSGSPGATTGTGGGCGCSWRVVRPSRRCSTR